MHGVQEATEHLAEYCRQNSSIQVNQVFTPRSGDTVDSTGERYIYQVRQSIALNLQQKAGGLEPLASVFCNVSSQVEFIQLRNDASALAHSKMEANGLLSRPKRLKILSRLNPNKSNGWSYPENFFLCIAWTFPSFLSKANSQWELRGFTSAL